MQIYSVRRNPNMKDAFPRSWCAATSPFFRSLVLVEMERERTDVVMMSSYVVCATSAYVNSTND